MIFSVEGLNLKSAQWLQLKFTRMFFALKFFSRDRLNSCAGLPQFRALPKSQIKNLPENKKWPM
jgi:hypothetical protein